MKWNESGFRPPLCTYRLNWARRTSWGWWDDTVLQTQYSKFEPWRSEAEHATSRSRRLPTILTFTRGWGRNNFVSFKPPRPGTEPRTLAWKAAVLTTTLGPPPNNDLVSTVCKHSWYKWLLTRRWYYQRTSMPLNSSILFSPVTLRLWERGGGVGSREFSHYMVRVILLRSGPPIQSHWRWWYSPGTLNYWQFYEIKMYISPSLGSNKSNRALSESCYIQNIIDQILS